MPASRRLLLSFGVILALAGCHRGPPPPKGPKITRTLILDEPLVKELVAGGIKRHHMSPVNSDEIPSIVFMVANSCNRYGSNCTQYITGVQATWTTAAGKIATKLDLSDTVLLVENEMVDRGLAPATLTAPWQDGDYGWEVVDANSSNLTVRWQEPVVAAARPK